jgi:hypothetical protein
MALRRLGGRKDGKVRFSTLTPEQRCELDARGPSPMGETAVKIRGYPGYRIRIKQNAYRHGLVGKNLVFENEEDKDEFQTLLQDLKNERKIGRTIGRNKYWWKALPCAKELAACSQARRKSL